MRKSKSLEALNCNKTKEFSGKMKVPKININVLKIAIFIADTEIFI